MPTLPQPPPSVRSHWVSFNCLLPAIFLGFLWTLLINHLRVEWTLNPQYTYGWAVPFICVYLLWRRLHTAAEPLQNPAASLRPRRSDQWTADSAPPAFYWRLLLLGCALLYGPTRLIQAANPEWRLVSWALAFAVIGLTLGLLRLLQEQCVLRAAPCAEDSGQPSVPHRLSSVLRLPFSACIFPICFFLVAVPWPKFLEIPVIQGLTRADAGATVELLGWLGIPALPHGNVIEVATGVVGIDEACSGIRSFQATLMISLFLGELYRLSALRRSVLVLSGFTLSFGFNLVRMILLVWVAASAGIRAIARWHDPAGVTILLACFVSLWGMAVWLRGKNARRKEPGAGSQPPEANVQAPEIGPPPSALRLQISGVRLSNFCFPLVLGLCLWVAVVEFSVQGWYRWHEMRLPAATTWIVAWPTNNPTFQNAALPEAAREILRYDEGRSAAWVADDLGWEAIFLRWNPGQTALHLAQNHTPAVCLTAAGRTLKTIADPVWLEADGLRLPFIVYAIANTPKPVFVFYCLWDDRASSQAHGTASLSYANRLTPVLQGLRNSGQRSLEIALTGNLDVTQAEAALQQQLRQIIHRRPSSPATNGLR